APDRPSGRPPLYQSSATELLTAGWAFFSFCPTAQLEADRQAAVAAGLPALYPGTCRKLPPEQAQARIAAGERPAIRFRVPQGRGGSFVGALPGGGRFSGGVLGDPVIVPAPGRRAYNFGGGVDDGLREIRVGGGGEDHISTPPRQILLYEALGFTPPQFAHLALVMGPDHSPLSKRHGATSVAEFRAKGYLPEALVNYLALIGWSPGNDEELLPVEELARRFSLDRVGLSAGLLDEGKLAWVNRHYLKMADPVRIAALSVPFFKAAGVEMSPNTRGLDFLATAMAMATSSVDRLNQIPGRLSLLFQFDAAAALA